MRTVLFVIGFILLWFLSAVFHEADLSRNFRETGDAKAFFFPIECEDCEKEESR